MTRREGSGRSGTSWRGRLRGWPGEVALVLVVGLVQIGGTSLVGRHQVAARPFDALGFALLAIGPLALLARRRYPVAVHLLVFGATLGYWELGYPRGPIFLAPLVAFVTVVMAGRRVVAWTVLAVGYVSFLWLGPILGTEPAPSVGQILGLAAWLLVLLSAAEAIRIRRERVTDAERTREEGARRRASEERLRIAREVHDVLAHNISLINVQAGVALHLMDERPEQARTALSAIKEASKETLRELRATLGVLRQVDEQPPRAPASGLARLEDLVTRAAAAGIEVRTEVEGDPRPLPAGVDVAAFRIVQEALTNVTRHADAGVATVRLSYDDRDLTLEVEDDGRGGTGSSGGHGIRGMRERAAALGGEVEAGPRPGGGFRVRARLPMDGTE